MQTISGEGLPPCLLPVRAAFSRALVLAWTALGIAIAFVAAAPAAAQERSLLLRDSFPVGSGPGILCQAQDRSIANPARQSILDRGWEVICRDSARPVAQVYAFADPSIDALAAIAPHRRAAIECVGEAVSWSGLRGGARRQCTVTGSELGWSIFTVDAGGRRYVAEGFTAYDSATLLALRSILADRVIDEPVDIATTTVTDAFAFARIQAETLDPGQALAEGYRRNLGGEYAEAAAYFEALQDRLTQDEAANARIAPGEFMVNRALQKSNLGEFAEAERLFAAARSLTSGDRVTARLQRNFEAMHELNRRNYGQVVERLEQPLDLDLLDADALLQRLEISRPIAMQLNASEANVGVLGFVDELKLSEPERIAIIDAQALQLRGTARRLIGETDGARADLLAAYDTAIAVRGGRVTSISRLRAQVFTELALIAERAGDTASARDNLRAAITILEDQYPDRRAVGSARARLAGLLLRNGEEAEAVALFDRVVRDAAGKNEAATGFAALLRPWFEYLAPKVESDAGAAARFFRATQVLVRPGVAETQAILSRELSAQSGDASRMFRQSIDLTRDIERARVRLAAIAKVEQTVLLAEERRRLKADLARLEDQQIQTQAALADFSEYRALQPSALELDAFRQALRPGEAYARLASVGGSLFMFYVDEGGAMAWPIAADEAELDLLVDELRATISLFEDGRFVTYPYDIELARRLHGLLFEPAAARIEAAEHLVFEPDAAMLRLPIDILVADDASVAAYVDRVDRLDGDPYDFTGVRWLASTATISTAVSAQAFVDARRAAPSRATREYLGLGGNTPVGESLPVAARPSEQAGAAAGRASAAGDPCAWGPDEWNRPIDTAELDVARSIIGEGRSMLLTGDAFTDSRLNAMEDIRDYRVIHFATHGLVTPPAPSCPTRPALLTSFGEGASDGLLSFREIFELDLDADIVILSACDTAGKASIQATREAGVGTGGGTALDGLVRSFIGAGGRSVIASHWPAPDDFDATQRLMNQMFRAGRTADLGKALRASQRLLMQDAQTSHPYYWGGFSVIGDAARPLLSRSGEADMALATPDVPQGGR